MSNNQDKKRAYFYQIIAGLKKLGSKSSHGNSYAGTNKVYLGIKVPEKRTFIKSWLREHRDISLKELKTLIDALTNSGIHEAFGAAGMLLEYLPSLRKKIDPFWLESWLTKAEGWAEVDALCSSKFTAVEILNRWPTWKKLLLHLADSDNPHLKRASLVLLTKAVRDTTDPRLPQLAFKLIDQHKREQSILVTKAISWLLREMVKNYPSQVSSYLNQTKAFLPSFVVKEVKNKLEKGKKR